MVSHQKGTEEDPSCAPGGDARIFPEMNAQLHSWMPRSLRGCPAPKGASSTRTQGWDLGPCRMELGLK